MYIEQARALKIVYVTGRYIYQQYEHKTTNRLVGCVDLTILDLGDVVNNFNYRFEYSSIDDRSDDHIMHSKILTNC